MDDTAQDRHQQNGKVLKVPKTISTSKNNMNDQNRSAQQHAPYCHLNSLSGWASNIPPTCTCGHTSTSKESKLPECNGCMIVGTYTHHNADCPKISMPVSPEQVEETDTAIYKKHSLVNDQPSPESWEKEFDEAWNNPTWGRHNNPNIPAFYCPPAEEGEEPSYNENSIKSFISKQIEKAKDQGALEVTYHRKSFEDGKRQLIQLLREEIIKMNPNKMTGKEKQDGYGCASSDILKLLSYTEAKLVDNPLDKEK